MLLNSAKLQVLKRAMESEIRWLEEKAAELTGMGVPSLVQQLKARAATLRAALAEIDGPNRLNGNSAAGLYVGKPQ